MRILGGLVSEFSEGGHAVTAKLARCEKEIGFPYTAGNPNINLNILQSTVLMIGTPPRKVPQFLKASK